MRLFVSEDWTPGNLLLLSTSRRSVPAEYASFRSAVSLLVDGIHRLTIANGSVHDALLSRLSNDDDPERSLSTFSNEMAASAMILSTSHMYSF